MSEEDRIPKYRVSVELLLTGQAKVHADLFLGEHAERHAGREQALDLLKGGKIFLPVVHRELGGVLIRRTAALVATRSAEEAHPPSIAWRAPDVLGLPRSGSPPEARRIQPMRVVVAS